MALENKRPLLIVFMWEDSSYERRPRREEIPDTLVNFWNVAIHWENHLCDMGPRSLMSFLPISLRILSRRRKNKLLPLIT